MSVPSIDSSIRSFYEVLLACRPTDPVSFAAEYFEDEKKSDPEYFHAMRMLVYLTSDEKHFRNASATIFSHLLEKSRPSGGGSAMTLSVESAKTVVAMLIDESYVRSIPSSLRELIDSTISGPSLGFEEFDIYIRLVVRTSVFLQHMRDLISSACALRMVEGSGGKAHSYDSIGARELRICLSNPKVKAVASKIPLFTCSPPGNAGEEGALVAALDVILQCIESGPMSDGVTASDIVTGFLNS